MTPRTRGAERLIALIRADGGPTCEKVSQVLGVSISALCLYLKGRRKIPLWVAIRARDKYEIAVDDWLDKPKGRTRAAA
jgi:hypothetical protein